ncbi:hypothetical protein ABQW55_007135 [Xanthomonas citri pv. malvacearum]|uniref:hypothetical protein n=1 Tax=Xanthomonas citri TaxID=346 RepID=UPI000F79127F|nr:hypothetical protein [Xanthomonas citri]NMI12041.1 hypothetical protein [Xanthomonas citri]WAW92477.1 hypothetical protein LPY95_07110 [Xanthomonas citri pv. malvacearum]WAW96645.1 hypothetical protein LGM68_07145 [Xanthomonas citri pv. malvacearum]
MPRIAQPLRAARMARRKRFERLRKPPRPRLDHRKVDAGQYKAKGCIPKTLHSRTWSVRPRLQSMAAISTARGSVPCIPEKVGLIGSLRRPTDARCGRCPRKRSAAMRQICSERAHGAGKPMRFVRFFCRW